MSSGSSVEFPSTYSERVAAAAPALESDDPPSLVCPDGSCEEESSPIVVYITFDIPGYESVDDPNVMIPARRQHIFNLVYSETGEPASRNAYSQEYLDHIDQYGNSYPVSYFLKPLDFQTSWISHSPLLRCDCPERR